MNKRTGLTIALIFITIIGFPQSNPFLVTTNDSLFLCNPGQVSIKADRQFNVQYPVISNTDSSLCTADHTSDGIMVTLSNGNIVHVFRLDP